MGINQNRHFSTEDTQMANIYANSIQLITDHPGNEHLTHTEILPHHREDGSDIEDQTHYA